VSFSFDVNVLLYASDGSSSHHGAASTFLSDCAARGEIVCLGWPTVMNYLRIATHPAIFRQPLGHAEALRNVERLLALPHVRMLSEEDGFLDLYRDTAGSVPVRGNLVPDAHLATLLRQHGVRILYTNDRDFRKFDFLEVVNPFGELA
jgi:toxin-antitoxin system PIN domain toxin